MTDDITTENLGGLFDAVAGISHMALLREYAGLTRRMQREETEFGGKSASSETRDKRELVAAEILRRMSA
jgi:hypothetical protein